MNKQTIGDNTDKQGVVLDTSDVEIGLTRVKVFRRNINEQNGKEEIVKVHEGVVLAKTTSFLTVYNSASTDKGGDPSPEASQSYPAHGRNAWCEFDGEMKTAQRIPALFLP